MMDTSSSSLRPRAFIGTRDLSKIDPQVVELFVRAARATAEQGIVLHTGAAPGADQKAAEACLEAGGRVKLFLPWNGFEWGWRRLIWIDHGDRVEAEVYDPKRHPDWTESVGIYHPNPMALAHAGIATHARNYGTVSPCGSVVALPRATDTGGTAQGIRVARALHIPVYDLSTKEGRERLTALLEEHTL